MTRTSLQELVPAKRAPLPLALRVGLFLLGLPLVLVALFYGEENWRGTRALRECERDFASKGISLIPADYAPKTVPDEQNFAKTPELAAIAYRDRTDARILEPFQNAVAQLPWDAWGNQTRGRGTDWAAYGSGNRGQAAPGEAVEAGAEAWLEAIDPVSDLLQALRLASLKPRAQFESAPAHLFKDSHPVSFVNLRTVAQVCAFHGSAALASHHHELAFGDLRALHRLAGGLEDDGVLVGMMIRTAILGLELQPFWEGWAADRWSDEELAAFQQEFAQVDLLAEVRRTLQAERASVHADVLDPKNRADVQAMFLPDCPWRAPVAEGLWNKGREQVMRFIPRGWICQNVVYYDRRMEQSMPASLSARPPFVSPRELEAIPARGGPGLYTQLAAVAVPNSAKALKTVVFVQTQLNQARIVCALERFRHAQRRYPETFAELRPTYLEQAPADLIDGQPLHYRPTPDGKFLLYSVGWNEQDDGGVIEPGPAGASQLQSAQGDWCWAFPAPEPTPREQSNRAPR